MNNGSRHRSSIMQDRPSNPIIDLQLPSTEIFIPLHDHVSELWFLLVMNLVEQHAELWDNMPDIGSMDRRKAHAGEAILLLHNIFANEMTKSSDVYYHFPSFNVNIPEPNPTYNKSMTVGYMLYGACSSTAQSGLQGLTLMTTGFSLPFKL
ncbi:hypothetical protein M0R45_002726 [Rubus argutus]|uniref:Uncharacterized protein n=1 Tax=Rubus argutus TaxID=59490 RepID=A0AAW1VMW4_RUBAR